MNPEPDARSDDVALLPSDKLSGNRLSKTYTAVHPGSLLGPAPALVVDLDPAGSLDLGKVDPEAMRRAVERARSSYDMILLDLSTLADAPAADQLGGAGL